MPTNLDTPPTPETGAYQSVAWNDGCDFRLQNTAAAPATQIDNTQGFDSSQDLGCGGTAPTPSASGNCKFELYDNTSNGDVHPGYTARSVRHTSSGSTNVNDGCACT